MFDAFEALSFTINTLTVLGIAALIVGAIVACSLDKILE